MSQPPYFLHNEWCTIRYYWTQAWSNTLLDLVINPGTWHMSAPTINWHSQKQFTKYSKALKYEWTTNTWQSESESVSGSVASDSLWPHGLYPARLLYPWDSPGKITGVGCHPLLQGIFPPLGLNPGLPHWQAGSTTNTTWEAPLDKCPLILTKAPGHF